MSQLLGGQSASNWLDKSREKEVTPAVPGISTDIKLLETDKNMSCLLSDVGLGCTFTCFGPALAMFDLSQVFMYLGFNLMLLLGASNQQLSKSMPSSVQGISLRCW